MDTSRSDALWVRAGQRLPGGVNSPVRAFRGVGGQPRFFASGSGAYLTDVDGNRYVDYVMSWGPLILGHAHPDVTASAQTAVAAGSSFGAPSPLEVELAEAIVEAVPSIEVVRLVCSGTEAGMAVVRLARGATGRMGLIKFDGCYHGHADSLLVAAGSGVATLGLPDSPGVPPELAALTWSLPYGDLDAVETVLAGHGEKIGAIIVEPVAGNMGVVDLGRGWLAGLRLLCDRYGVLLIFDEVMTGFRVARGGVQGRDAIKPDLTMLGKVIGGGYPLAAYGGRADLMRQIAPAGPIYQAGTLAGNPVAVSAGLTTLRALAQPGVYEQLEATSARLADGLADAAAAAGVPLVVNRAGSMFTAFFTDQPVTDYATAKQASTARFAAFFWAMLERGVYLPPSQFEAWFPGLAHDAQAVATTLAAAREAFAICKSTA
ncbi:MAG: glutamate-1-semialdehyde 2,1-aminomutase [Armatimonadetes bacterium]|nr:glutamate-1-semialdehyde 2,1-aminomutase [Armatimonadota bacterium]